MDELGDIESIVNSVETSTNNEIPMNDPAPAEAPQLIPEAPQEYEFEAEGRKYKGDIAKLTRWAQQGVSAPNKIGELSKRLQDTEGKLKGFEPYEKVYKPIDEWAKQNPEKWQSLFQAWQQAQYGGVPQGQATEQLRAQLPPELVQTVNELKEFKQSLEQEKVIQRERHADQGLDSEIGSIRKQYSNIDFDSPDERGNSLEYQILEHATKNGIPSFRAAFRDFCFDKLGQLSESKGLEKGARAIPEKTKAGLLGKDPAPARGKPVSDLIKNRNMDQIHQLVLSELGL